MTNTITTLATLSVNGSEYARIDLVPVAAMPSIAVVAFYAGDPDKHVDTCTVDLSKHGARVLALRHGFKRLAQSATVYAGTALVGRRDAEANAARLIAAACDAVRAL